MLTHTPIKIIFSGVQREKNRNGTLHIASVRASSLTEKRVHPRRSRWRGGGILEKRPEGLSPFLLMSDTLVLRGFGLLDGDDEVAPAVRYYRLLKSRVASSRKTARDTERTAKEEDEGRRRKTTQRQPSLRQHLSTSRQRCLGARDVDQ